MGRKQTIFLQQDHLDRVISAFSKLPSECSSTDLERATMLEMKFVRLALEKLREDKKVETNGMQKRWCRYRWVGDKVTTPIDLTPVIELGRRLVEEKAPVVPDLPKGPRYNSYGTPCPALSVTEPDNFDADEVVPESQEGTTHTLRESLDAWIKSAKSKEWTPVYDVRDYLEKENPGVPTSKVLDEIRTAIKDKRLDRKTDRDRENRMHRSLKRF